MFAEQPINRLPILSHFYFQLQLVCIKNCFIPVCDYVLLQTKSKKTIVIHILGKISQLIVTLKVGKCNITRGSKCSVH